MATATKLDEGKDPVTSKDAAVSAVQRVSFPSSLNSVKSNHSSYLVFHIVKPLMEGDLTASSLKTRQSNFMKSPADVKSVGMIQLYMPSLTETVQHEYASSDTGLLSDLAQSWVNAGGEGFGKFKEAAQIAGQKVADRMQQAALAQVANASAQVTGQIHRQRNVSLYGGTALRTQTFTFQLRPRNLAELKDIGEIIYMFRKYASGSRGTSAIAEGLDIDSFGTVDVPHLWFVEERLSRDSNIVKRRFIDKFMMGPAVVSSIRLNKTPDQVYQTLANTAGDPVAVELEIQMQEMIPTYSDFWDTLRDETVKVSK